MDKKTILVVEDDIGIQKALVDKLTEEGFLVLTAINGKEGLEDSKSKHPDLILLDLIMPVMDGMSMLKELRQDSWGKNAKVMLLTNLSGEEKISEALGLVTFDYLIKTDWSLSEVVDRIKQKIKS